MRHSLILIHGFVRETEVYDTAQRIAMAAQPAVTFSAQLESLSSSYVAIFNSEHEKWNNYSDSTKKAIEVLNLFDIKPVRSLILAVAEKLPHKETEKSYKFCVSRGVRLIVASSTRTGSVEGGLAKAAHKMFAGDISSAAGLKAELRGYLKTNTLILLN